jgi:hypothetical protein
VEPVLGEQVQLVRMDQTVEHQQRHLVVVYFMYKTRYLQVELLVLVVLEMELRLVVAVLAELVELAVLAMNTLLKVKVLHLVEMPEVAVMVALE